AKFGRYYSPTAMPDLLARVRGAWKDMTAERHRDSLIADARRPDDRNRQLSALKRLSDYYPKAHDALALEFLNAPTNDARTGKAFVEDDLYDAERPQALPPGHALKLFTGFFTNEGIYDRSAKIDRIVLDRLGTVDDLLATACIDRLIGRGYDAQIEAHCRRRL